MTGCAGENPDSTEISGKGSDGKQWRGSWEGGKSQQVEKFFCLLLGPGWTPDEHSFPLTAI